MAKRQKTSHNESFNNSLFDVIPDDLLSEILIRLPDRRNVMRCSGVCKKWLSLFAEPLFVQELNRRHGGPELQALIFQNRDYESRFDPKFSQIRSPDDNNMAHEMKSPNILSFLPWNDAVIRASFDDLLLISRPDADKYPYHDHNDPLTLYICNPAAKKWLSLKPPPRGILKLLRCGLVCYGHLNSQFRVVVLCKTTRYGRRGQDKIWVTVFSSEARRWSPLVALSFPILLEPFVGVSMKKRCFNTAVALRGYLYWLGDHTAVFCMNPFAAANPLAGRCWQLIRLPQNVDTSFLKLPMSRLRIGACEETLRLGYVSYFAPQGAHILRVWELVGQKRTGPDLDYLDEDFYYSSSHCWSLVYDAALAEGFGPTADIYMLAFHPSDPDVVFVESNENVFRYDMAKHRGVTVGKYPAREPSPPGSQVSTHALCVRTFWPSVINNF